MIFPSAVVVLLFVNAGVPVHAQIETLLSPEACRYTVGLAEAYLMDGYGADDVQYQCYELLAPAQIESLLIQAEELNKDIEEGKYK